MPAQADGIVLRGDAKVVHVLVDGESRQFVPRGRLFDTLDASQKHPIAVGDRVRVSLDGDPPAIDEVLPRDNWLSRIASSHDPREQVLFSNVDRLFVLGSMAKPKFSSNRTDRIVLAAAYAEIPTTLLLNKIDLAEPDEVDRIAATYRAARVDVLKLCAADGRGLDALAEQLRGRTSAFYGASGAGKSTTLNALEPALGLKTAKISKYWDAGRHTTTYSQMHRLESLDAWVIDTPGIRSFRPAAINKSELRDQFPEFEPFAPRCRFPDCSHDHEPGCAVFDAVEAEQIAVSRYASYVEILDELAPPPEDDSPVAPPDAD